MKKYLFLCSAMLCANYLFAQDPVHWEYSVKKIAAKSFEVHLVATIDAHWHIYAQRQPEDAIAVPTKFAFNANPLLHLKGSVREVGSVEKYHDKQLGISANQYSKTVEFVQQVELKASAKTNISGQIEYQTCNDERCLPPRTVFFTLNLK